MIPFDYQPRTRIVFGADTIERLGELAGELGARRALVVSDPGVIQAGHTARGIEALRRAGIEAHLFDAVREKGRNCRPRARQHTDEESKYGASGDRWYDSAEFRHGQLELARQHVDRWRSGTPNRHQNRFGQCKRGHGKQQKAVQRHSQSEPQ